MGTIPPIEGLPPVGVGDERRNPQRDRGRRRPAPPPAAPDEAAAEPGGGPAPAGEGEPGAHLDVRG